MYICAALVASLAAAQLDDAAAETVIAGMRHRLSQFKTIALKCETTVNYSDGFAESHNGVSQQHFQLRAWIDGSRFRSEVNSPEVLTSSDSVDFVSTFDGGRFFFLKTRQPTRLVRGKTPAFDFAPDASFNPLVAPYAFVFLDGREFSWTGLYDDDRWSLFRAQMLSIATVDDNRILVTLRHPKGEMYVDVYLSLDDNYLPIRHVVRDDNGTESETVVMETQEFEPNMPRFPVKVKMSNFGSDTPVTTALYTIEKESLIINKPVTNVQYTIASSDAIVISDTDTGEYTDKRSIGTVAVKNKVTQGTRLWLIIINVTLLAALLGYWIVRRRATTSR